jgi:seryl-tRNA synthetase
MPETGLSYAENCQVFSEDLVAHQLFIPQGAKGLYGFGAGMELVIAAIERVITAMGVREQPEVMRFPPLISRRNLERSDYLQSFPNLAGSVHSFGGDTGDHARMLQHLDRHEDWSGCLEATGVVLAPAACYAVYPVLTGVLPGGGRLVDVVAFVFRNEPSDDPTRLQVFRLREYVLAGDATACRTHSRRWVERGIDLFQSLGLPVEAQPANDPFFGRTGRMLAASQRDQQLKIELLVPICSDEQPTACGSCNYHQDHFGKAFDIRTAAGEPAHSACVGFGLERIALALFRHHGFRTGNWPEAVRRQLGL